MTSAAMVTKRYQNTPVSQPALVERDDGHAAQQATLQPEADMPWGRMFLLEI